MVVPLQWAVHMDEKTWREPDKFNPSRFLDEEGRFLKPEGFIPFQTGGCSQLRKVLARVKVKSSVICNMILYHINIKFHNNTCR